MLNNFSTNKDNGLNHQCYIYVEKGKYKGLYYVSNYQGRRKEINNWIESLTVFKVPIYYRIRIPQRHGPQRSFLFLEHRDDELARQLFTKSIEDEKQKLLEKIERLDNKLEDIYSLEWEES